MAALKQLLPPVKSTVTTQYDHSNDPWFKQRFSILCKIQRYINRIYMKFTRLINEAYILLFSSLGLIGLAYVFTKLGIQDTGDDDQTLVIAVSATFILGFQIIVATQRKRLNKVYRFLAAQKYSRNLGLVIAMIHYVIYFRYHGHTMAVIYVCGVSLVLGMLLRVSSAGEDQTDISDMLANQQLTIMCHIFFQNNVANHLLFSFVTVLVTQYNVLFRPPMVKEQNIQHEHES